MLTNKSKEDAETQRLAFIAAALGNLEEFQRLESLLKGEFDVNMVNEHGCTCLMTGSIGGHLHVVTYLMGKAALVDKLDSVGRTALWLSVNQKDLEVARLLLQNNANPNIQPYDKEECAPPSSRCGLPQLS